MKYIDKQIEPTWKKISDQAVDAAWSSGATFRFSGEYWEVANCPPHTRSGYNRDSDIICYPDQSSD